MFEPMDLPTITTCIQSANRNNILLAYSVYLVKDYGVGYALQGFACRLRFCNIFRPRGKKGRSR